MKIRKIQSIILVITMIALTACNKSQTSTEQNKDDLASQNAEIATETVSTVTNLTGEYSEEEIEAFWEESSATKISFHDNSISIIGNGAASDKTLVSITQSGTYVLSGTLTNGQVIVEAGDKDNVQIVLNNVSLNSDTTCPLYIKNAKNVYLTLAEGTANSVTDATTYIYDNETEDEPNAAIFSTSDLIINGNGSLLVTGNYNNGIRSKDDLKIVDGTILVTSKDDGIVGKDSITIRTGQITVNSQGDAFKSTNSEDTSKGYIIIDGGNYSIGASADGFQAETSLIVNGGTFDITTNDGSDNGSSKSTITEDADSAKAFKAGAVLTLNDGVFHIDSADDSIHSNGTVTVTGGNYEIASGDDAIHADGEVTIEDGTILITKSYEGMEGENITINGGTLTLTASDDGINISGGTETTSNNDRTGQKGFEGTGDGVLTINGGTITVDAKGDGLDANGSIVINGGTTYVSGSTDGGNGVLDYDKTFAITGGVLMAAGSTGMAMTPSATSTQASIVMIYDGVQSAGTLVHLEDIDGNDIATFSPLKDYQFVVISSPSLTNGSSFHLYAGGTYSTKSVNQVYTKGNYNGGTLVHKFTVSETINANQTLSNNGGFGGQSGLGGKGEFGGKGGTGEGPMGGNSGERPERPAGQNE